METQLSRRNLLKLFAVGAAGLMLPTRKVFALDQTMIPGTQLIAPSAMSYGEIPFGIFAGGGQDLIHFKDGRFTFESMVEGDYIKMNVTKTMRAEDVIYRGDFVTIDSRGLVRSYRPQ